MRLGRGSVCADVREAVADHTEGSGTSCLTRELENAEVSA